MIDIINILQYSQGRYFSSSPGEESGRLFCIVSDHHELVIELGEERLDSFPESFVSPCRRPPVLLIQAIGNLKGYLAHVKEILLYFSADISFVP